MTTGPIEYIIVGFPGNKFSGEIAPELAALVESGTIRVLDLIFIALCAVVSGVNDCVGMARFAATKREWLAKYLDLDGETPKTWEYVPPPTVSPAASAAA